MEEASAPLKTPNESEPKKSPPKNLKNSHSNTNISIVNFQPTFSPSFSNSPPRSPTNNTLSSSSSQIELNVPTGFSVGGGALMGKVDSAEKEEGIIEPKVFVPYERTGNLPPRKVEVER
jgi:hypothetical protein